MDNTYTNKIIMKLQDQINPSIIKQHHKIYNPFKQQKQEIKSGSYQYLSTRAINLNDIPYQKNQRLFICIYHIRKQETPFLEYLLYKYPKKECDVCIFPFIVRDSKKQLKIQIIDFFKNIINIAQPWTLKGYIQEKEDIYMLFHLPHAGDFLGEHILRRGSDWWWCLIDEICNQRHVVNFPIHYSVTNLFLKNPDLIYLKDTKGDNYPIPRALYYGTYSAIAPFYFVFGPKQTVSGRYGPYYYLGSYEKIIRYAGWSPEYTPLKKNNVSIADEHGQLIEGGGIIRYAVFLGKIKVLLNHPHDEKHSDIPIKNTLDFQFRMEDRDGKWATNYDSLYYGRAKLAGTPTRRWRINPAFVTKKFNQQIPVSMHLLDKKTLKTNWDPHYYKYYIQ